MYDKKGDVSDISDTETINAPDKPFKKPEAIADIPNTVQVPNYLTSKFWKTVTYEQLKEKLKNIADVNEVHPENKQNMLHLLVKHGKDPKMIDILISAGVDYTATDNIIGKGTALHYAVIREKGDYEWTKELLKYNHNINIRGETVNASPLMWASYNRSPINVIKLLLEKGANSNFKSQKGTTPLIAASIPNKIKNISFIDPQVIQLLLAYKADITIKDLKGKTALDYMRENEEFTKTELFKKLSAQSNSKSQK